MRTFRVVAALVLTFICTQENSASPVSMVHELEETGTSETPSASQEQTSWETWLMPYTIRENASADPLRCQYCCGCCVIDVCGLCCQ